MFVKLYSRITESSLMEQPVEVRYTFLMLLAIADPTGRVVGTDIAIARRLNMPVEDFVKSVKLLNTPDADSNSKEEEGRRILPSDGERGYQLVNFLKYRNLKNEDEKREYMREYMRKRRADKSAVKVCKPALNGLAKVTQAEAEAEAEADKISPYPPQAGDEIAAMVSEIYKAYPKKVGRPAAEKAIRGALKTIEAPRLLEVTRSFAASCAGADLQFVAHPATWFNQQRFNDDPSTWTKNATHQHNPAKPHRNDFIAGAYSRPNAAEILKRREERAVAERAAAAQRPVAAEVAGIGSVAPEGAGSL